MYRISIPWSWSPQLNEIKIIGIALTFRGKRYYVILIFIPHTHTQTQIDMCILILIFQVITFRLFLVFLRQWVIWIIYWCQLPHFPCHGFRCLLPVVSLEYQLTMIHWYRRLILNSKSAIWISNYCQASFTYCEYYLDSGSGTLLSLFNSRHLLLFAGFVTCWGSILRTKQRSLC